MASPWLEERTVCTKVQRSWCATPLGHWRQVHLGGRQLRGGDGGRTRRGVRHQSCPLTALAMAHESWFPFRGLSSGTCVHWAQGF